jgi:hypothetical protein
MIRAIIDSLSPILPRNVLQQQVLRIVDATRFSDREYFFVATPGAAFFQPGAIALILRQYPLRTGNM